MMQSLTVEQLSLCDTDATRISHRFEAGRITVLLGRNKAGKTRLCRLVAGLETAAAGRVLLGEQDITQQSPRRRSVALVNQAFVNYPTLTVRDNIASPLRAAGRPRAECRQRAAEIAEQLQLGDLLERLPAELSGGQQQRVAIGRALAKDAAVLLLDEPLVNLDYKLREALEVQLHGLLKDSGKIVLYASSDPRDAFNLGDEVVLLKDHALLQSGAPLEVYARPASLAAAELLSEPGVNACQRGASTWAVRPEHLQLVRRAPSDAEFRGKLLSFETNGSETFLHLEVEQAHWVARLAGLHGLEPGSPVSLYAADAAVHRFDGDARG